MDYRVISIYLLEDILCDYEANDMTDCETYQKLQEVIDGKSEGFHNENW